MTAEMTVLSRFLEGKPNRDLETTQLVSCELLRSVGMDSINCGINTLQNDSLALPVAEVQYALSAWFEINKREMPWRITRNPYHIWLSEIILQQTRVEQGIPYFMRLTTRFPTVESLSDADLDEVLQLWEGLGYYSRARNLHKAAKMIVEKWSGLIPSALDDLLSIPGVGPYTAAAISSIAFGHPHAVLDGNVIRVLSRIFAFPEDVALSSSKQTLHKMASALLDVRRPGDHNESMMELGALVCTPKPDCPICPVRSFCKGFETGTPTQFPVKRAKKKTPHYHIAVGVIRDEEGRIFIQKRSLDSMLGGLWEFPGGKNESTESYQQTCRREILEETGMSVDVGPLIASIPHAYSHFKITLHAYDCELTSSTIPSTALSWEWAVNEQLQEYAFPKANRLLINMLTQQESGTTEGNND